LLIASVMMKTLAMLALVATTACAGTTAQAYYTMRTDMSLPDLVPVAEATARAHGYTITDEQLSGEFDKAFVAVKPSEGNAVLVQVANRARMASPTHEMCNGRCITFTVTPLGYANQKLAVPAAVPAADADRARDLVTAISGDTMKYRALETP
jgi:hypothetical protein